MVVHRIKKITDNVKFKPWAFLGVFLVAFFLISVLLYAVDFVPEPVTEGSAQNTQTAAAANAQVPTTNQFPVEEPTRIVISSIGVDTPVENPSSTDPDVLDNALLKGATRYPESGLLGGNAGVYIFGHQSYLPVVHNQAFKAFNGLQKLTAGEIIEVYSATAKYTYTVTAVEHVSADNAIIDFATPGSLTLSTCDSFGKKTDRNVVTAQLVSREPITQTNS